MFRLTPSKQVLRQSDDLAVLVPEYKSFTFVPGMPESLLTLCNAPLPVNYTLLHLHTNYTEADSVLRVQEPEPVNEQCIQLPFATTQTWLTLLEVDPKLNVYALLSDQGALLFFRLRVRLGKNNSYEHKAEEVKQETLRVSCKQASSLCLGDERYFLVETSNHGLKVYHCNIVSYEVTEAPNVSWVVQHMLKDYNTENNILGCKRNVIFYKEEPIATVPKGYRLLSVFGTQCNSFQLLVQSGEGIEWWRWTGSECEAVRLSWTSVPKGNLLWF